MSNSLYFERVPDAPVMTNDATKTHATRIGVKWSFPAELGGHTFLNYRLTWDQGTGVDVILADSLLVNEYLKLQLTTGKLYVFKIQAQTTYGWSDYSPALTILTAQ